MIIVSTLFVDFFYWIIAKVQTADVSYFVSSPLCLCILNYTGRFNKKHGFGYEAV